MNCNIIFNLANNSSLGSAVNREYVHATFFQKSGGTMSGDIDLNKNDIIHIPDTPETNSSIVNKKYVSDNYLPKSISDPIDMKDNAILNLANNSSPLSTMSKQYAHNIFLPKLGGRMQGPIDMSNRNITNIPDIVSVNSAVVNKKYVDDKISKISFYQDFQFTQLGRTIAWGRISGGNPVMPMRILNLNSKTIITIETISSDTKGKTFPNYLDY